MENSVILNFLNKVWKKFEYYYIFSLLHKALNFFTAATSNSKVITFLITDSEKIYKEHSSILKLLNSINQRIKWFLYKIIDVINPFIVKSQIIELYKKIRNFVIKKPLNAICFISLVGILLLAVSLYSIKIAILLTAFIICLSFLIILIEDPSISLYVIVLYALVDYIFRKAPGAAFLSSYWDELLFIMVVFLWILNGLRNKNLKYKSTTLDLYLIFFLVIGIFWVLIKSPELKIAIDGFRVIAEYLLWFFVGVNLIKDKKQFNSLINLFIFMGFLIALYGIYQYIIGVEMPKEWIDSQYETYIKTRVFSIIGSPNVLGSLLILMIPINFTLLIYEKGYLRKGFHLASLLAMGLCLIFTFSRGAWIALFIAMLLYGMIKDKRILALLLIILLLIPVVLPSVYYRLAYMASPEYIQSSMKGGRLARWAMALDTLSRHLYFGVGYGRYGGAVAARNIPGAFYVDNFYLKYTVETGILGLIILLFILLISIRYMSKTLRSTKDTYLKEIGTGIFIGLIAVLLHNFVENIFEVPMMTTYFWFFTGLIMSIPFISSSKN